MWLFQIIQLKQYPEKSPNHTDLSIDGLIVGARWNGIVATSYAHAYKKNPKLERFDIKVTEEEYKKVYDYIISTLGTPYEYSNLINHIRKVFTGKWKKQKNNKVYCIEHTAKAINLIKPGFVENPDSVNPYEFYSLCKKGL